MAKRTPQQLRDEFLERAYPLLEQYVKTATEGEDALRSVDSDVREEVWNLLKGFMKGADGKIEVPPEFRGKPEGIISAAEAGHITIEEAERLIELYRGLRSIETMGTEGVGQTNVIPQLVINAAPTPQLIEGSNDHASDKD